MPRRSDGLNASKNAPIFDAAATVAHNKKQAQNRLEQPGFFLVVQENIRLCVLAEKSDPFMRARMEAHYRNGIAGDTPDKRGSCHYECKERVELLTKTGFGGREIEVPTPIYFDVKWP